MLCVNACVSSPASLFSLSFRLHHNFTVAVRSVQSSDVSESIMEISFVASLCQLCLLALAVLHFTTPASAIESYSSIGAWSSAIQFGYVRPSEGLLSVFPGRLPTPTPTPPSGSPVAVPSDSDDFCVFNAPVRESSLPIFSHHGLSMKGYVISTFNVSLNACQLEKVPPPPPWSSNVTDAYILLVPTTPSKCSHRTQARYAENAGYRAVIIYNVGSNSTEGLDLEPRSDPAKSIEPGQSQSGSEVLVLGPADAESVFIPVYFIGEADGHAIRDWYTYERRFFIRIQIPSPLLSTFLLYGIWFGLLMVVLAAFYQFLKPCFIHFIQPWCIRVARRRKRADLVRRLIRFPIVVYAEGQRHRHPHQHQHTLQQCIICMEDYVEGDHLRILYCSHGFHQACIDKWLVHRARCPICKATLKYRSSRPGSSCWHPGTLHKCICGCCCRCGCCGCSCPSESEWSDDDETGVDMYSVESGADPAAYLMVAAPPAAAGLAVGVNPVSASVSSLDS